MIATENMTFMLPEKELTNGITLLITLLPKTLVLLKLWMKNHLYGKEDYGNPSLIKRSKNLNDETIAIIILSVTFFGVLFLYWLEMH